jgi:hypothetical protein
LEASKRDGAEDPSELLEHAMLWAIDSVAGGRVAVGSPDDAPLAICATPK